MSYPLLYYIGTTLYGILGPEHYYPYWFMNPALLSYGWIVTFFVILLGVFLVFIHLFLRIAAQMQSRREVLEEK